MIVVTTKQSQKLYEFLLEDLSLTPVKVKDLKGFSEWKKYHLSVLISVEEIRLITIFLYKNIIKLSKQDVMKRKKYFNVCPGRLVEIKFRVA